MCVSLQDSFDTVFDQLSVPVRPIDKMNDKTFQTVHDENFTFHIQVT